MVATPTPVTALGSGVTAAFAGRHFTLAVRDGFVYSWGWDLSGELGYTGGPTNLPRQVPGLHDIVDVSTFDAWCVALRADGTVWSWGGGVITPRQVLVPAGYKFTGVKMGSGFTLATIAPACPADFGSAGGEFKPDGRLDNNDFIAFINAFFAQDPLADCGSAGGTPTPDSAFDNNDFVVFITQFFGGC
ncbi:MAG: GC-type dockerin domain-anchored protein [Phycisphaerales bacterium]